MEGPAGMALEPGQDLGVFVGGIVVKDDMDHLARRHLALDGIEKANELLMAMLLHALPHHLAIEDIERGEQGGGAVAFVVMGHGAPFAGLDRQAGLGAIERLDLRFLVD